MLINKENEKLIHDFVITSGMSSKDCDIQAKVVNEECDEILNATTLIDTLDGFGDVIFANQALKIINDNYARSSIDVITEIAVDSINNFLLKRKKATATDQQLNEILNCVCVSNMSKFDNSQSEAVLTVRKYKNAGIKTYCEQVGSRFVIRSAEENNEDFPFGKILKSAKNYRAPCFREVILKNNWACAEGEQI